MGPIQLVVFDVAGTTVDDHGIVLHSLVETLRPHAYLRLASHHINNWRINRKEHVA